MLVFYRLSIRDVVLTHVWSKFRVWRAGFIPFLASDDFARPFHSDKQSGGP